MTTGSRTIDFMSVDILDHFSGVNPNLRVRPVVEIKDKYEFFHDYTHNVSSFNVCDMYDSSSDGVSSDDQLRSTGIIFIVDKEDVSIFFDKSGSVCMIIVDVMKKCGLEIFFEYSAPSTTGYIITFLTSAGYVIARTGRDTSYIRLDIHFWTMFQLQTILANWGAMFRPRQLIELLQGVYST